MILAATGLIAIVFVILVLLYYKQKNAKQPRSNDADVDAKKPKKQNEKVTKAPKTQKQPKTTRHALCVTELANATGAVTSAAYDPSGHFVCLCSADGTARLFFVDSITSNDHRHFRILFEGDCPTHCSFTSDGSHVVFATNETKELYAV